MLLVTRAHSGICKRETRVLLAMPPLFQSMKQALKQRAHAVRTARLNWRHHFRAGVVGATSAALVLTSLPATVPGVAHAQPNGPTVTMQECGNLADPEIRRQIRDLTEASLNRELGQIDYAALVVKHWREVKMDARLDTEVDLAIEAVRAETGIFGRAYSTISRETAEKTAIAVAERAFNSEGFKAAIADLAQGIGKDFGNRVEQTAGKVASPIIACVRSSLQTRYGSAIAQVFTKETEENVEVNPATGGAKIGTGDLVLQNAGTITGIMLVVSRRIVAKMVASIGRRIAGLVASRIVASFTGIVGIALLLSDIYDATEGVFPLISERMKSDEAKQLIKDEMTKTIEADLRQQIGAIADETADRIYSLWLDFKQKYAMLLGLAEKNEAFAAFLKDRKIDQLGRLGQLVTLIQGQEGEQGVFRRTNDGSLTRAMLDLDDAGVAIALSTKSIDKALAWSKLAGRKLGKVMEYGLPQIVDPAELTDAQFQALMAFDERMLTVRVAQLDRGAREAILALPAQHLKDLVRRLSERELSALATYQARLQQAAAQRILRAVAEDPLVMKTLESSAVQDAVLNSRDQTAAINMMLRDNSALSVSNIVTDFSLVREGQVHYRVFVERYWVAVLVLLFVALLVLLWLRRLFFARPATVVIKTADGDGSKR